MTEIRTKRKMKMKKPIETARIGGQLQFDLHDVLHPVQIEVNDDRILNVLKNIKAFTTNQHQLIF